MKPNVDAGSVWIDPRDVQEGTHPLVLDGGEHVLAVGRDPELRLSEYRFEGGISLEGRDCRVRGSLTGNLETGCDRCLTRFTRPFAADVSCRAVPEDAPPDGDADSDDTSIALDPEGRMDLALALGQAVLLEVPIQNVCRPDCPGICPACGANKNLESCDCSRTAGDPRWDALRSLPTEPKE